MKRRMGFLLLLCSFMATGCSVYSAADSELRMNTNRVTKVITGRVENPDQILQKVRELEEVGMLTGVQVLELLPLQVQVTGAVEIVQALEALSRNEMSPSAKIIRF